MWLAYRDIMAQVATVVLLQLPPAASKAPSAALADAPLEFRCRQMQVFTDPNRAICQKDVVIRRANLLVCCDEFEGQADRDWAWQHFTCTGDVRAQRPGETMWAQKAEFIMETADLILTGSPKLHRGRSLLEGERVVLNTRQDRAHIEKPRGRLQAVRGPLPASNEAIDGPLPETCPIPPKPGR